MISDEDYRMMQSTVQTISSLLLWLDRPMLDAFIERAQTAQGLGPVLHPSEWLAATDQMREILTHACAIRTAARTVAEASG